MSSQCNHFVQNAWKKELCSNCFKPREEHSERGTPVTMKMKTVETKTPGILRGKTSSKGKKKVAFPDTLSEVIGYGGDDFSDSEEFELSEQSLNPDDDLPDGEEERALCNLTRANTSFNTVTANLSSNSVTDSKKSFASLMLGKPRKDSDGKKKTLLVSVTPFGADTNVPSAKRPSEKKTTFSNLSLSHGNNKSEVAVPESKSSDVCTLKSINNIAEDKILRDRNEKEAVSHEDQISALEKIVDMPLITSSNLISVIQKSDSLTIETSTSRVVTEGYQKSGDTTKAFAKPGIERKIGITRTPAVKKQKDVEKPKVLSLQGNYKQTLNTKNEYIARTSPSTRDNDDDKSEAVENREKTWSATRGKDVNKMAVQSAEDGIDQSIKNDSPGSFSPQVSRELAGEPDGKADEEMVEPPALPRSPPPLETRTSTSEPRNSFLHNVDKKLKPAVPQKPNISLPPKPPNSRNVPSVRNSRREEDEVPASQRFIGKEEEDRDEEEPQILTDAESELVRSPNKRRMAPKPPPPTYSGIIDEAGGSLFARNPGAVNVKSDSPVVREKEKRERASSCSPKFRKDAEAEGSEDVETPVTSAPEPAPRRMISLSQDSLANADSKMEDKKKARSRFSLKKFLRMGSKKDQIDGPVGIGRFDDLPTSPQPGAKPRLEIIHPLELDGAAVEVVSRERVARLDEDAKNGDTEQNPSSPTTTPTHHPFARPGKPPPPPRNQSLDDWARLDPANKPARPPPPRTEIKSPSKSWHPSNPSAPDLIYANLAAEDVPGEVRSSLAPSKPQRTASMRDQAVCQPPVKKRTTGLARDHHDYEPVSLSPRSPTTDSPNMSSDHHAYECLSSSPECDSSLDLRHGTAAAGREGIYQANNGTSKRKSDSSVLDPGSDFKYSQQPFTRSTSLPYCGSETESELYSPYSFYTGDEGPEEDQDWKTSKEVETRGGRLGRRRGRSIVHRSLEDNYGAVVVANHEALAQILEQLNQSTGVPPALRGLKTANLRLSDFKLDPNSPLPLGRRIFYAATWNESPVTVCVALDLALHVSRKEFNLLPIIEFRDTVPDFVVEKMNLEAKTEVEATVSVLPRLQVTTIGSFAETLKDANDEGFVREASFVLLQLVNALKSLQARGVEEAPKCLNNAVLCRENKDACYRLYLLQCLSSDVKGEREEERASLCQCVLEAIRELDLSQRLPLVRELLERERTATLSQVKSVLEFSLWGPADVPLGGARDREMTLQRWLDLERATVLHALVRARAPLAVTDEYHLLFLVRTSAKIMCEASMLLDAQRRK